MQCPNNSQQEIVIFLQDNQLINIPCHDSIYCVTLHSAAELWSDCRHVIQIKIITVKLKNCSIPIRTLGAVAPRFTTDIRHFYWLLNRLTAATTNGRGIIFALTYAGPSKIFLQPALTPSPLPSPPRPTPPQPPAPARLLSSRMRL